MSKWWSWIIYRCLRIVIIDIIYTIYIWCIIWIIYTLNVATRISIENDKIDFNISKLKWIVASLMFFRLFLFLYTFEFSFGWHSFGTIASSHGLFYLLAPLEQHALAVQQLCMHFWVFQSRYTLLTILLFSNFN